MDIQISRLLIYFKGGLRSGTIKCSLVSPNDFSGTQTAGLCDLGTSMEMGMHQSDKVIKRRDRSIGMKRETPL